MAEGKSSGLSVGVFLPKPGLTFVSTIPRIVEIVLRGVALFLCFCILISASVVEDKAGAFTALDADNNISLDDRSKAAGGWLLFISIICAIYEVFVIVVRFLNFGIVNDHFTIVAIVDMIVSGGFTAAFFAGAVATAVYSGDWADLADQTLALVHDVIVELRNSTGATAAFSFFIIFVLIGLAVLALLFILLGLNKSSSSKHSASSTS